MTMKKLIIFGLICLLVFAAACNKTTESVSETSSSVINESSTTMQAPDVVDGYLLVIDYLAEHGSQIGNGDKYLAIDTSKMVNLSPGDKTRLIKALDKFNLQVLNKTQDELEKEGYMQKNRFENGSLMKIADKKMESNSITMDATISRGFIAGFGMKGVIIRCVSGHWEIVDIEVTFKA
jgi:hypothetical protein